MPRGFMDDLEGNVIGEEVHEDVLGGAHACLPTFCRLDTKEKVCQENIPSPNRTKKRQIFSLDLKFFNLLTYMNF